MFCLYQYLCVCQVPWGEPMAFCHCHSRCRLHTASPRCLSLSECTHPNCQPLSVGIHYAHSLFPDNIDDSEEEQRKKRNKIAEEHEINKSLREVFLWGEIGLWQTVLGLSVQNCNRLTSFQPILLTRLVNSGWSVCDLIQSIGSTSFVPPPFARADSTKHSSLHASLYKWLIWVFTGLRQSTCMCVHLCVCVGVAEGEGASGRINSWLPFIEYLKLL